MRKLYEKMAQKRFFRFFLKSKKAGIVILKALLLLFIPYAWLFILSAVFGGLFPNFIVPEMALVIILSSAAILLFDLFLMAGAFVCYFPGKNSSPLKRQNTSLKKED